ncbi:MAG: gamma carbonic anhydrase family protein [Planctomycetes bacterium]|nr:gamma carbonic anhydrase family protein [Planctomycetota bacterium]
MLHPQRGRFARIGAAFAADNATLTGEIELGEGANIWFGCVLRGDDAPLSIGADTNVQDLSMIHADPLVPNRIGARVTIGHRAILHGALVEDECLIAMGAILLGGSRIGAGSIVAAGAVVKENLVVPPRSLVVGIPGRIVRELGEKERQAILHSAAEYRRKVELYLP